MRDLPGFREGLAEIEGKAEELRALARKNSEMRVEEEAAALDRKAAALLNDLYRALDPWRKTLVARHPDRPHCKDYVDGAVHRVDPARRRPELRRRPCGHGRPCALRGRPVVVIGQEKGNDTGPDRA